MGITPDHHSAKGVIRPGAGRDPRVPPYGLSLHAVGAIGFFGDPIDFAAQNAAVHACVWGGGNPHGRPAPGDARRAFRTEAMLDPSGADKLEASG